MIRKLFNRLNWVHHGVDCDDMPDDPSLNYTTFGMFYWWAYYWLRKIVQFRAIRDYGDR